MISDRAAGCASCCGPRSALWPIRRHRSLSPQRHAGHSAHAGLRTLCQAADSDETGSSTASNRLSTIVRQEEARFRCSFVLCGATFVTFAR